MNELTVTFNLEEFYGTQGKSYLGAFLGIVEEYGKVVGLQEELEEVPERQEFLRIGSCTNLLHLPFPTHPESSSYFHQLYEGLGIHQRRQQYTSIFLAVLEKKIELQPSIRKALMIYLASIVFIQDHDITQKSNLTYYYQCKIIEGFLQGEISEGELEKIARAIHIKKQGIPTVVKAKYNNPSITHTTEIPIEQIPVLTPNYVEVLLDLKSTLSQLMATTPSKKPLIKLFYQELTKSIQVCYPPSIHSRASKKGYFLEAKESSMTMPMLMLFCAAVGVKKETLEKHQDAINKINLCLRLANDFFSLEREKAEGIGEYKRNIIKMIGEDGFSEKEAQVLVVKLYNSILQSYKKARAQWSEEEQDRKLYACLDWVNDAPLFIWKNFYQL